MQFSNILKSGYNKIKLNTNKFNNYDIFDKIKEIIFLSSTTSSQLKCTTIKDGCSSTQRMIQALRYCASLVNNVENDFKNLYDQKNQNALKIFSNETYKSLLDDYVHIMGEH
eukprot:425054_1